MQKKFISLIIAMCLLASFIAFPNIVFAEDTNLALASAGATATGGAGTHQNASNAIDGDINTEWSSWTSDATTVKSLTVTLAKKSVLSKVLFTSSISNDQTKYSVFYKIDENDEWTRVPSLSKSGNYIQATMDGITAQYVKVEYANNKNMRLYEIEIYGTPIAEPSPYLTEIIPSEGSLYPAFSKETAEYEVEVESLDVLPTLSYEKEEESATVEYTEATSENGYKAEIKVTHSGESFTYYVHFKLPAGRPYLTEITSTEGTLSPAFNQMTSNYEILIESLENLPTLSFEKEEDSATVEYTEATEENDYKATIEVSHRNDTFTYYITFKETPGNPVLQSLSSADGSLIRPAFSQNVSNYTLYSRTATPGGIFPDLEYEVADGMSVDVVPATAQNNYTATVTVTHKGVSKSYYVQYLINWAYKDNMHKLTSSGSSSAEKAVDGNRNSEYHSETDSESPYLQVEFERFVDINSIAIYSIYTANQVNYRFYYSQNGSDWTVATGSYYKDGMDLMLTLNSPVTAKYVRITPNAPTSTSTKINELYVFGTKSDANPFLSNLTTSEGELLPDFDPMVRNYELPAYSLTELPTLSYEKMEPSATDVYIAATEENDYTASITVSHHGVSVTYKVKYTILEENSTALKYINLSINGGEEYLIEGFEEEKTEYFLDCNDMDGVPVVTAEAVHRNAIVEIEQGSKKNMVATITVTSPSGQEIKKYTITYLTNIAKGCAAWASSSYDGYEPADALDGDMESMWFAAAKVEGGGYIAVNFECMAKIYNMTVYNDNTGNVAWYNDIKISTDGTTWQPVTGVGIKSTSVTVNGKGLYKMDYTFSETPVVARYIRISGTTTSINNSRITELIVNGVREPMVSSDASLKDIKVNGSSLAGFSPYVTDYTVSLNAYDSIPVISVETTDISATANIIQATENDPVAKIVVTAENGASKMTYTVTFKKELAPEKNTYLSSLSITRGTLMPAFAAANTNYTLYLTPGSESLSANEIVVVAESSGATIVKSVGNPSTITVTSADGTQSRTYTINIVYDSANLSELNVIGYELQPAFSPSVTDYIIELQAGESLPLIGVQLDGKYINPVAESGATMSIVQPTEQTLKAIITVTDESGVLKKNYSITFKYAQSLAKAQETVQTALRDFTANNDTTADDVITLIKESITNDAIEVRWTMPFSLKKATSSETGLITGAVTISYGSEKVVITIRKAIDKLVGGGGGGSSSGGGGGGGSSENNKDNDAKEDDNKEDTPPTIADVYSEIRGHWAENEVIYLAEKGIVKGNGESFALNDKVTRAEFITMLIRAAGFENAEYEGGFTDVSTSDWYAQYIQTAFDNGFIEGYNGMVSPLKTTTREEAVKMLVGVYENINEEIVLEEENMFSDSSLISEWANTYVQKALSTGLVQGFETGEFRPKDNLTRAQAMVMIYRLINQD